jgi:prephenate dehydrogenase
MAGSGFDSTVRIAKSSTSMWTPILQQNADYLIASIDKYMETLCDFKKAIANNDSSRLFELIDEANKIRKVLNK